MLGPNAKRLLVNLSALWPKLTAAVRKLDGIRGSGIARVTVTGDGIDIHVPPPAAAITTSGKQYIRLSSATGDEQPFTYEGTVQKPDASADDYFADSDTTPRRVENLMELVGTNCGYQGGVVSGLWPLPTGFLYEIVDTRVDEGEIVYLIREMNQPKC